MSDENERLKDKERHFRHRFMFQVASMLYYYSLFKREHLMKEDSITKQKEIDSRQLEKILISDYSEPLTAQQLLEGINEITKLEEKYTINEIDGLIAMINEPSLKAGRIPNIMTIRVGDRNLYFHKYRFILMFFYQQSREGKRLRDHYIKQWAEFPRLIPASEKKFEESLRENISPLFFTLLNRVIPSIFSHPNPQDELKPDEIAVKNEALINSDLTDGKKVKEDYNLFIKSVFNKKDISKIQPLHYLFGFKLKELKKEAFKHRARTVPIYKIIFSWFFNLIEAIFSSGAIKNEIRNAIEEARKKDDPLKELSLLVEKFKSKNITSGQLEYLRRHIYEAKKEVRENLKAERMEKEAELQEKKQMKAAEVKKLKDQFLHGKSLQEKLEEYSRCFAKVGKAKKDTEEAVKSAIHAHFRKTRGRLAKNPASIKSYANAIVEHNTDIFSEIKDKETLKKYIELLLLGVFLRTLRR